MAEKFVVDCNVAAKWVLPEPGRAPPLEWFDRFGSGDALPVAPDIVLAEFASLAAKRHRRKQISAPRAGDAHLLMTKAAPRLFEARPRLSRALDLSLQYQLSLWDSVYLGLARNRNAPC